MKTLSIFIILFFSVSANAQLTNRQKRQQIGMRFIENYNAQEYNKMKKPFIRLIKIIVGRKGMANEFAPKYKKFGKVIADTSKISFPAENKMVITFMYQNDTANYEYINFYFNNKNKVQGFGISTDNFRFLPNQCTTNCETKVDSALAEYFPDGFNGQVLFTENQQPVFKKSYGYADLRTKTPFNDTTVFELASCSKQFTAIAILKLHAQGKLSLDDTLRKFFPELPYSGVTVKHLLTHTGGLPDYMELLMKKSVKKKVCFNTDIIEYFAAHKPKVYFQPGAAYEYSNTGYALLASIVEKTSGMTFGAYLDTYFFEPLGMRHTRIYNTRRSTGEVIPNYAYGYVYDEKKKGYYLPDSIKDDAKYVTKLDGIVGDGTVNTTITDLIKWDEGLTNHTILSKELLDEAYTSGKTKNGRDIKYGYGVMVETRDNTGKIIAHTGGWPGYQTLIYRFVDKGKMLVILSNKEHPDDHIMKAAKGIVPLFIDK